jgi:hypothetical protein
MHPNAQVRITSDKATLAIAPVEARAALERLAKSLDSPQRLDAGMCLWNMDRGIFKPT